MRGDRVEGVPHKSDSRVAIQRALQILAEDRAKNQRLKSRRRNLMLGIRLEDVQYKSEQRLGEGTTAIRARTLPAGNHGTNDASPSRYCRSISIVAVREETEALPNQRMHRQDTNKNHYSTYNGGHRTPYM